MKKKIMVLITVMCMLMFCGERVYAAAFSVSTSSQSITIGEKVQIYIKGQVAGRFNLSVTNGSLSSNAVFIENVGDGASIQCVPSSVGTTTVTITASDVSTADYQEVIGSQSISIQVKNKVNTGTTQTPANSTQPTQPSNKTDLTLKSLDFSVGKLTHEFKSQTFQYELIDVPIDTKVVKVTAQSNSNEVKITGAGEVDIASGKREIIVKVSDSKSNQYKEYIIKIRIEEKPVINLKMNDQSIGVFNDESILPNINGFINEKISIENKDIHIKRKDNIILIYGVNEKGERNYYIYQDGKITSIYKPITLMDKNFVIVDAPKEVIQNNWLKESQIEINRQTLQCYEFVNENMKNYCLVYLLDDNNEGRLYQYDKTMNTLQIYSETIPLSITEYDKEINSKNIIIYVLITITILSLGFSSFLLYKRRGDKS